MIPAPRIRKAAPGRYVVYVGAEGLTFRTEQDAERFTNAAIRARDCTWIEQVSVALLTKIDGKPLHSAGCDCEQCWEENTWPVKIDGDAQ